MRHATVADLTALVERCARDNVADLILRSGSVPRWRRAGEELSAVPGMLPAWSRFIGNLARELTGQTMIASSVRAGTDLDVRVLAGGVAWRCNLTACAPRDMVSATAEQAATQPRDLCMTLRRLPARPPRPGQLGITRLEPWLPKQGLVLVSGIPGSGKSTLLASVLRERVRRRPDLLMTYESPVEVDLQDESEALAGQIIQHDLPWDLRDPDTERSASDAHYAHAMRNLVRRAANGVYLGEVRAGVVAASLIDAVRIGMVVYTTIHAPSAALAPSRLLGMVTPDERRAAALALRDGLRLLVHAQRTPEGGFERVVVPVNSDVLSGDWTEWGRRLRPLEDEGVETTPIVRNDHEPDNANE